MYNLHVGQIGSANGSPIDNPYAQQSMRGVESIAPFGQAAMRFDANDAFCGCGAYERSSNCCPPGTHFSPTWNMCVPDDVPENMLCRCPTHMHYDVNIRACIYDTITGPEGPYCPTGMAEIYDNPTNPTVPGTPTSPPVGCVCNPIPVCPNGFRYSELVNGCVKDLTCCKKEDCNPQPMYRPPEPCPPKQDPCVPSQNGGVCPPGYVFVPAMGACVLESFMLGCLGR